MNISENDNSLNLDLAKEVAPYFRLSAKKTNEIINDILNVVKNWRKIADKYDIKFSPITIPNVLSPGYFLQQYYTSNI